MATIADVLREDRSLEFRRLIGARVQVTISLKGVPFAPPILADVRSLYRAYWERDKPDRSTEVEEDRRLGVHVIGNTIAFWLVRPKDAELHACRVCGCHHLHACAGADGMPCSWSLTDPTLCTACEAKQ